MIKINVKHSFTVGSVTRDFELNTELPDAATADQIEAYFEGLADHIRDVKLDLAEISEENSTGGTV